MTTMEKPSSGDYVVIRPDTEKRIEVKWAFTTFVTDAEPGRVSCVIPSFGIYFSAKEREEAVRKSVTLTKMWFDHFFIHRKNKLKDFAIEMHKRGFSATKDAYVLKQLLGNHLVDAKFRKPDLKVPSGYKESDRVNQQSEMLVGI